MSTHLSEREHAPPLVVRSDRVVLPDGVRAAAILLRGGRIASIAPRDAPAGDASDIDAGDLVVLMSNGGFGGIHRKLLQALA